MKKISNKIKKVIIWSFPIILILFIAIYLFIENNHLKVDNSMNLIIFAMVITILFYLYIIFAIVYGIVWIIDLIFFTPLDISPLKKINMCPRCRSTNVKEAEGWYVGVSPFYSKFYCKNCGFSASVFPELVKNKSKKIQ